jgi:TRAP-type mannitol/chloroaromatic compound transport system permease small subunit
MRLLILAIERRNFGVGCFAAQLIVPLVVATCYEVFARYLFGAPTIWAFELGYMLTGAYFLLGSALTLQRGEHIRIDLIYARLSPRRKALIDLCGYVALFIPFSIFLGIRLWEYMASAQISGEGSGQSAWNPPIWPFRLVFFVGFATLGLQALAESAKCLLTLTGRPLGSFARG